MDKLARALVDMGRLPQRARAVGEDTARIAGEEPPHPLLWSAIRLPTIVRLVITDGIRKVYALQDGIGVEVAPFVIRAGPHAG